MPKNELIGKLKTKVRETQKQMQMAALNTQWNVIDYFQTSQCHLM
jgi:hypothetical protein